MVDSRLRRRCRIVMNCNEHCSCLTSIQLVPPPGELLRKITSCLILAHLPQCIKILRYPQNRKYIKYCNAVRGHVVFKLYEWTDRQTDRQTSSHTHHNPCTLPGAKQYTIMSTTQRGRNRRENNQWQHVQCR